MWLFMCDVRFLYLHHEEQSGVVALEILQWLPRRRRPEGLSPVWSVVGIRTVWQNAHCWREGTICGRRQRWRMLPEVLLCFSRQVGWPRLPTNRHEVLSVQ